MFRFDTTLGQPCNLERIGFDKVVVMFDRQSLKRSRRDFEESISKYETMHSQEEQDTTKSSFVLFQDIHKVALPPQGSQFLSPLCEDHHPYPRRLQELLTDPHLKPIAGYAHEIFWMGIENTLYVWSSINIHTGSHLQSTGGFNLGEHEFSSKIQAIALVKSQVVSFVSKKIVNVFVVALEDQIELFVYEDQKLTSLNITIDLGDEFVQQIVSDSRGNIYYAGDSGIVKQIQNRSNHKTSFRSVNGMNFLTRLSHNFSLNGVRVVVKRIVINQKRNRLHCLVVKVFRNSWLSRVLSKVGETEVIDVETYVLDNLSYLHRFNNNQLHQQVLNTNDQYRQLYKNNIRIVDIFVSPDNLLVLMLQNGIMVKLINTKTIAICSIVSLPEPPLEHILLQRAITSPLASDYTVESSLGQNNLTELRINGLDVRNSIFEEKTNLHRNMSMSIGNESFDYSYNDTDDKWGTFERTKMGVSRFLEGTIFAEGKEFLSFSKEGIRSCKRLTPLQLLVVILNIHVESTGKGKDRNNTIPMVQVFSEIYSPVRMVTYLIQILCRQSIQATINSQIINNTKYFFFGVSSLQVTNTKIVYSNINPVRDLAELLISRYEHKAASVELVPMDNVYARNLNQETPTETNVLWNSLLYYFNELSLLTKHLTVRNVHKEKALSHLLKVKLSLFERFLRKKLNKQSSASLPSDLLGSLPRPHSNIFSCAPYSEARRSYEPTSNLMLRLIQHIKKVFAVISACDIYEGFDMPIDLSVEDILKEPTRKETFGRILVESVDRNHPVLVELVNRMPEFLGMFRGSVPQDTRQEELSLTQILTDLRQLFNNYTLSEAEHTRFQASQSRAQMGDIFQKAEMEQAHKYMLINFHSIKQDQETFQAIISKLIDSHKNNRTPGSQYALDQALDEVRKAAIPVYVRLADSLLESQGMDAGSLPAGTKREELLPGMGCVVPPRGVRQATRSIFSLD